MGWGRDELNSYYYWGGKFDLQEYLRDEGYEVYTLSVGPISSNYDRAVEAYYQIKGGQVDYGKLHSEKYGLMQTPEGKNYEAIYPEWSSENPIHLIGHSQGGQTARMLEYLLQNEFEGEGGGLLANKQVGWIKSITTISTPHNGTTLAPIIQGMFPFIQSMVVWLGVISQNQTIDEYFSFDLDQWGIHKMPDENLLEYISRIKNSEIATSRNFSTWDLSPEGAEDFNTFYETDSSVYYFSFATSAKSPDPENGGKVRLKYKLQAVLMENYGEYPEIWYENDGIVNTISMNGPTGSKTDKFSGTPIPNVWQKMDIIYLDHHEVVGHQYRDTSYTKIKTMYTEHCKLLQSID